MARKRSSSPHSTLVMSRIRLRMKGAMMKILTQNSLLRWVGWFGGEEEGWQNRGWVEMAGREKISIFQLLWLDVVN